MTIKFFTGISAIAFAALQASAAPILSIQPGTLGVPVGKAILLNVRVTSGSNLYAYQFDVTFTPGVLAATAVGEGDFLSLAGTTQFISGTIDNAAGRISAIANTLTGSVPGATGDGTLAVLQFNATGAGVGTITPANVVLLDSTLEPIASEVQPGTVGVSESDVPEPGTFTLALAGLAAAFVGWRARRG